MNLSAGAASATGSPWGTGAIATAAVITSKGSRLAASRRERRRGIARTITTATGGTLA
jgi:hypothetical protein